MKVLVLGGDGFCGWPISLRLSAAGHDVVAASHRFLGNGRAKIVGETVVVSSPEIARPVAVRYAWAMNPSQRNLLYNKEGLPASPFRTDTWPLFDPNDSAVRVEKPEKTDEALDAKRNFKDWERPTMTQ